MLGRTLGTLSRTFFVMYLHVGMFVYMVGGVLDNVVFVVLRVCCVQDEGRGIYQRPSTLLRVPCTIGLSFFVTVTRSLEKVAVQSSSHLLRCIYPHY